MRYCSHCGNALSAGASFCHSCGAALKAFVPETDETPVATPIMEEPAAETPITETAVEEPIKEESTPVVIPAPSDKDIQEERAFLDQTHRLLRWERRAWSISGKVALIVGIVFAVLFFLIGVIAAAASGDEGGIVGFSVMFIYAFIFGGILIAVGIVSLAAANKIPQYTDTLYKDFRATNTRCNSIGLIVFGYFFNNIALVFYLINFVRMKSNKPMIERILTRQGVK